MKMSAARQSFSHRLRSLRVRMGISQAELGGLCGLHQMEISHYECGRREPNLANLRRLVRGTGQSADYFVGTDALRRRQIAEVR